MDTTSESRLEIVHPKLAGLIRQLNDTCTAAGHPLRVIQGLRSWNDQLALWAKGRTQNADGSWTVTDRSQVVTDAPPGSSWHNFGLAVDVCPSAIADGPFAPDWNISHPIWSLLISTGEGLGMFSGSCFHHLTDNPHFQLTGKFPVSPDDEVRQLFRDGGMNAIWEEAGILA